MNLIKYNSGFPSKNGHGIMDDFFTRSISEFMGSDFVMNIPSVNVKETADNYLLELAVPGLEKDDFQIQVVDEQITVSADKNADKKAEAENKSADEKFNRREFNYAAFSRSFSLPETVNTEAIEAGYENGILTITLGKKEEAKPIPPKRIDIS